MALAQVAGIAFLAGMATPLGGLAARPWTRAHVHPHVLRGLVAFGGGLLFAAVALVLVPQGLADLELVPAIACLLGGAVLFLLLDVAVERRGGRASQVLASALDSVPESLGLGAAFALGGAIGPVLVLMVAMQNLPEGFNSVRELRGAGTSPGRAMGILFGVAILDPLGAGLGYLYLGSHPGIVAALFLVAAGGILYLLMQDIAPMAHRDGHWAPTLAAVAGFAAGIVCQRVAG